MWKEDQPHGDGIYYYFNGEIYRGSYFDGEQHGWGEYLYPNGSIFQGEWKVGKKDGPGKNYDAIHNDIVIGKWRENDLIEIQQYFVLDKDGQPTRTNPQIYIDRVQKPEEEDRLSTVNFENTELCNHGSGVHKHTATCNHRHLSDPQQDTENYQRKEEHIHSENCSHSHHHHHDHTSHQIQDQDHPNHTQNKITRAEDEVEDADDKKEQTLTNHKEIS